MSFRNGADYTPENFKSEYDIPSSEIQDLISRNPGAISVYSISLAAAGTKNILEPGMGFAIYGYNSSTKAKYYDAYVQVGINLNSVADDPSRVFPGKSGRGFRGSFTKLALSWPADPNSALNSLYFMVFKSNRYPWIGGQEAS